MIRINLQQTVGQTRRHRAASVGGPSPLLPALMLLAPALVVVGGAYHVHQQLLGTIAGIRADTARAEAEIRKLKPILDELERFRKDKALLEKKLAAMEALEGARRGPTRIFAELGAIMPRQVWVTAIKEHGMRASLDAIGLDSQSVAVFVNAMERSPYFANVELTSVEQMAYLGLKVKKFVVTCEFRLPETETQAADSATSARAPAGRASLVAAR